MIACRIAYARERIVAMTLPPLPSLRALTAELRALHDAWSHPDAGGEMVALMCVSDEPWMDPLPLRWAVYAVTQVDSLWVWKDPPAESFVVSRGPVSFVFGREYVPGTRACWANTCVNGAASYCPECFGTGHVPTPFDATAAARRLLAAARDGAWDS